MSFVLESAGRDVVTGADTAAQLRYVRDAGVEYRDRGRRLRDRDPIRLGRRDLVTDRTVGFAVQSTLIALAEPTLVPNVTRAVMQAAQKGRRNTVPPSRFARCFATKAIAHNAAST